MCDEKEYSSNFERFMFTHKVGVMWTAGFALGVSVGMLIMDLWMG